jgi:S1-C subfamily serine protease
VIDMLRKFKQACKAYKKTGNMAVFFKFAVFITIVLLLSMVTATGCVTLKPGYIGNRLKEIEKSIDKVSEISLVRTLDNNRLNELNREVTGIVEKVTPSVVNIGVSVKQKDMFGNERVAEGVGSGIIYSSDGYIITNNHVAGDAFELNVTLADGTGYPATLVGTSPETDIAVIKIDAKNLEAASFASIEDQSVGDFVMAVGSPFGIQQTVTTGIISGKNRNIPATSDQSPIVDLIQTDAAINPGNSGGPLVNIHGEVIGINTLIFSPSGASAGIGFAIPSDTAINIAKQIIAYGEPRIPFIGIVMGENNTKIAGVYIDSVLPDSPAAKTGLKAGDIIVEFSGKSIKTTFDLLTQILRQNCGDNITLKVYRDSGYISFKLKLEQCPPNIKR